MTTEIWMQKCKDYKLVENFRKNFSDELAETLWTKIIAILEVAEEGGDILDKKVNGVSLVNG